MGHIKHFEISNFKKFEHLEIDNISDINLITGDNNIGKTSLLEALALPNENIDTSLEYLHKSLCTRGVHIHPHFIHSKASSFPKENYFKSIKNNNKSKISFSWTDLSRSHTVDFEDCQIEDLTEFDFEKRKPDNYNVENTKYWIRIYKDGIYSELQWMYMDDFKKSNADKYWPLISFNAGFGEDINEYYAKNIGEEKGYQYETPMNLGMSLQLKFKELDFEQKQNFLNSLSVFIQDIEDTTIKSYGRRDILSIKVKAFPHYQPITYWGEGFNKFVRYLLEIIQCRGSFILIDEIDTGIHWTRLKEFWENIVESCILNKVQLFATTHSKECIESFAEAANSLIEVDGEKIDLKKRIRLIEMKEPMVKGKNKIYANTLIYDEIVTSIETGVNYRGGNLYE
jgi:AAA15 family ATPase/GTPase